MSTYKAKTRQALSQSITAKSLLRSTALTAAGLLAFSPGFSMAKDVGSYDVWEFRNIEAAERSQGYVRYEGDRLIGDLIQEDIGELGHVDLRANLTVATGVEQGVMHILGTLTSTGDVFVLDTNGFLFGNGSKVDVHGSFAAIGGSASSIELDGDSLKVEGAVSEGARIDILEGATINVGDAGMAAFVAPTVVNDGIINAKLGTVEFAAGKDFTLDLYGDGLMEIAVDGKLAEALLENKGEIYAEGGVVRMTALAAKDAVDNIINVDGLITVASAEVQGGKIVLNGGDSGVVQVAGTLDASGAEGGEIDIDGYNINVTETAELTAKGGQDSDGQGNGGRVDVIADNVAVFRGEADVSGGSDGGAGGFVETSGPKVRIDGRVKTGGGEWLIDPTEIRIVAGAGEGDIVGNPFSPDDSADDSIYNVAVQSIIDALNLGDDVTIQTNPTGALNGDILIQASIGKTLGDSAVLTLNAHDDIVMDAGVSITSTSNALGVEMYANFDGSGAAVADVLLGSNTLIDTNGGNVVLSANNLINIDGDIQTGGGSFTSSSLTFEMDNAVPAGNLDQIVTAGGDINITANVVDLAEAELDPGEIVLDAGAGTVAFTRLTDGSISLGDNNGGLHISQLEVDAISAGALSVGGTNTQTLNVDNVDTTSAISGEVTLLAQDPPAGNNRNVEFDGANAFNGLNVTALDDVVVSGGSIDTNGGAAGFNAGGEVDISGAVATNGGDFTSDSDGKFTLAAALTTSGGLVDIDGGAPGNGDVALEITTAGSIDSGDANISLDSATSLMDLRGDVDAGTGDIDITAGAVRFLNSSTITADAIDVQSARRVTQSLNSSIVANLIGGSAGRDVSLVGLNDIVEIGDFATGTLAGQDGGFVLNNADGVLISGAVSSDGGDIAVTGNGGAWTDFVELDGSIASNGGNVSLDAGGSAALLIDGSINAGAGDVDLEGGQVHIRAGSSIAADLLNTVGKRVIQAATSTLTVNGLTGVSQTDALFEGTANDIGTLYSFDTGAGNWSAGGFTLVDTNGLIIDGAVRTDTDGSNEVGGDVDIDVTGDIQLAAGASIDAHDNNIDVNQTGTFTSVDADSVRTSGTGTINLYQNDGGSIDNVVDALGNTGTGLNTIEVAAGSYNENVTIGDNNVLVNGAQVGVAGTDGARGVGESTVTGGVGAGFEISGDNVTVDGFTVTGSTIGASVDGGSNAVYQNMVLDGNTEGARLNDATSATLTASKVTNSTAGVVVSGTSSDAVITDNEISNATAQGILVTDTATIADLSGNDFDNVADYIENRAFGTSVDASDNTFDLTGGDFNPFADIVDPNDLTQAELDNLYELEDATTHVLDNAAYGKVEYVADQWFVTTNTSGIQAAVDAASAGNTINVDSGTFIEDVSVNKELTLYGANKGVAGDGVRGAETFLLSVNGFQFLGADNTTLDGFQVQAINSPVALLGGTGVTITNNILSSLVSAGVAGIGASEVTITNNSITSEGDTVTLSNVGGFATITGNVLQSNDSDGVVVATAVNVTVDDNVITTSDGENGVELSNLTGVNSVSGNEITQTNGLNGIVVNGASDLTVDGNTVSGGSGDGIELSNLTGSGTVSGNTVSDVENGIILNNVNGTDAVNRYVADSNILNGAGAGKGIDLNGGSFVTISNNDTVDDFATGVEVSNAADVIVDDNTLTSVDYGVVADTVTGLQITDNTAEGNSIIGIDVDGAAGAIITGNNLDSFQVGIDVDTSNGVEVGSNIITNTTDTAIDVNASDAALIELNTIDGTNNNGIALSNAAGGTVQDNDLGTSGDAIEGTGILVDTVSGAFVQGNTLYGQSLQAGIDIQSSNNATVGGVGEGNTVEGFEHGITVSGSNNVTVQANTLNDTGHAIVVTANSDGAQILDNVIDVAHDGIFVSDGSDSALIDDNDITNTISHAISLHTIDNVTVTDNFIDGAAGEGIIASAITNSVIGGDDAANRNAVHNRINNVGEAIRVANSTNVVVGQNDIDSVDYGVRVLGGSQIDVEDNVMTGNSVVGIDVINATDVLVGGAGNGNDINNFDVGINVSGSTGVEIIENQIDDSTTVGIQVATSDGTQIFDNEINDNDATTYVGTGISVSGSDNVLVDGNRIEETTSFGIQVLGDSDNADIIDNEIVDSNGTAIDVRGGSDDADILGNDIDVAALGINVQDVNNVVIDNNDIDDVTNGITTLNVTGTQTITDNHVDAGTGHNGGTTGISVTNGQTVVIGGGSGNFGAGSSDGNEIDDFTNGIVIAGATTVTIDNNDITDGEFGIDVDGVTGSLAIADNDLDADDGRIGGTTGIEVTGSNNVLIGGNNDANDIDGYVTSINVASSDNVDITDNTIVDTTTGIRVDAVTGGLLIDDNAIDGHNANNGGTVNSGTTGIYVTNTDNAQIGAGVSGGNDANNIDDFETGIRVSGGTGVIIDANDIDDGDYGINADGVAGLEIYDNRMDGRNGGSRGQIGIYVENSANAVIGALNDGNSVQDYATGIQVVGSNGVSVELNTVTETTNTAVLVQTSDNADILDNTIDDATTGISVNGGSTGLLVDGNTIDDVSDGILTADVAGTQTITGNDVDAGGGHANGDTGIGVTNGETVIISALNVIDDFENGIVVDGAVELTVDDNTVTDADYGIDVDGVTSSVTITDNTLDADDGRIGGTTGIDVTNSAGILIGGAGDGNDLTGFDTSVNVASSDDVEILDNTMTDTNTGVRADLITSGLLIDDNNIQAHNGDSVDSGDYGIYVTNTDNARIGQGGFGGNAGNTVDDFEYGVLVEGGTGVIIDANDITDGAYGIYADTVAGLEIYDNDLDGRDGKGGNGTKGIYIVDSASAIIGANSDGNAVEDYETGIEVEDSDATSVAFNTIDDIGGNGIYINSSDFADVFDNDISDVGLNGILVNPSHDVEIRRNEITGAGLDGIQVVDSDRVIIDDNRIYGQTGGLFIFDNGTNGADRHGIFVTGGEDATINNNDIEGAGALITSPGHGAGEDGIRVENNARVQITNNNILGDETGIFPIADGAGNDGVFVSGSANAVIDNNTIDRTGDDGIDVEGSFQVQITNNNIDDADSDGIELSGSDEAFINLNTVEDSGSDGIDVSGSDDVEVTFNTVIDSGDNGIEISDALRAHVDDNTVSDSSDEGILIDGGSERSRVRRNTVTDSGDHGILVVDSDRTRVRNNTVTDTGEDGIEIDNSDRVRVRDNTITDAGEDAIRIVDSDTNIQVSGNTIITPDDDGIELINVSDATVDNNTITTPDDEGIELDGVTNTTLSNNTITDAGDEGIELDNSSNITIDTNTITNADNEGIEVDGGSNITITGNTITDAGDEGMDLAGITGLSISGNTVTNSDEIGIEVDGSTTVSITGNTVTGSGADGIEVDDSAGVTITGNTSTGNFNDGIDVDGADGVVITGNTTSDNDRNGIRVYDITGGTISGNTANDNDMNGIALVDVASVNVTGNTANDNGEAGIYVDPSSDILVDDNDLDGNDVGVSFLDVTDSTISNNRITNSLTTGIQVEASDAINIVTNDVSGSGFFGLHVKGGDNAQVALVGNTFTDNTTGAFFESGEIDLTGDTNTFNGGTDAMVFAPFDLGGGNFADLSLVDDTIGTTTFSGQSGFYVALSNGAFFDPGTPTVIDATNATFDGINPSAFPTNALGQPILPVPLLAAIEARLFDFDDLGTLGQLFAGVPLTLDNFEDFFNGFGDFAAGSGLFSVTLTGLPPVQLGAFDLANIQPAAGGEEEGGQSAEDLAAIEPAAGGDEVQCWGDAAGAAGNGQAVTYSFGGSIEDSMAAASGGCASGESL